MTTYTFDFQKIADGLTVKVHINDAHKQQLQQQMLERFERTGGKAGMGMPMRIAAIVAISMTLVGTVVVVTEFRTHDSGTSGSREIRSALAQVQSYHDKRDILGLVGSIDHEFEGVQLKAIQALGQIGDAQAIAVLL